MKEIWKYVLQPTGLQAVFMPLGAKILSAAAQRDQICIWALVDTTNPKTSREFAVYGTGHRIDRDGEFIGTALLAGGSLVFHVFEVTQ